MTIWIDSADSADLLVYLAYSEEVFPYKLGEVRKQAGSLTWLYSRTEDEVDAIALGMGRRQDVTLEKVRRAGGVAARAAQREGRRSIVLARTAVPVDAGIAADGAVMPGMERADAAMPRAAVSDRAAVSGGEIAVADWLQAWTEGWLYGLYRFQAYRQATKLEGDVDLLLQSADWPELSTEDMQHAIRAAECRAEGVKLARDCVNETPGTLNPDRFAEWMAEYFNRDDAPVRVHVYKGKELEERQMNGLIAVGAGSQYAPSLVEIRYEGDPSLPMLALVGKGVTFDMGGMNVKTASDISDARMDMGGAAAVIGAMDILLREQAKVNVTALIPVVDNVPDAAATLPSSVVRYPNGLTVQIVNTDGEGRLILADALIHAANIGAAEAVDIATLTGNVGAALGLGIAGIWGDAEMTQNLVAIGERNGERLWPMPLMDEYEAVELRSDYADLRNTGRSGMAGAITAALFIRRFVAESMNWVHIDMAGTVQYKQDVGYAEVGATGYGARLLADYAKRRH